MDSIGDEEEVRVTLDIDPEGPLDAHATVEVEYEDKEIETRGPSYYFNA